MGKNVHFLKLRSSLCIGFIFVSCDKVDNKRDNNTTIQPQTPNTSPINQESIQSYTIYENLYEQITHFSVIINTKIKTILEKFNQNSTNANRDELKIELNKMNISLNKFLENFHALLTKLEKDKNFNQNELNKLLNDLKIKLDEITNKINNIPHSNNSLVVTALIQEFNNFKIDFNQNISNMSKKIEQRIKDLQNQFNTFSAKYPGNLTLDEQRIRTQFLYGSSYHIIEEGSNIVGELNIKQPPTLYTKKTSSLMLDTASIEFKIAGAGKYSIGDNAFNPAKLITNNLLLSNSIGESKYTLFKGAFTIPVPPQFEIPKPPNDKVANIIISDKPISLCKVTTIPCNTNDLTPVGKAIFGLDPNFNALNTIVVRHVCFFNSLDKKLNNSCYSIFGKTIFSSDDTDSKPDTNPNQQINELNKQIADLTKEKNKAIAARDALVAENAKIKKELEALKANSQKAKEFCTRNNGLFNIIFVPLCRIINAIQS